MTLPSSPKLIIVKTGNYSMLMCLILLIIRKYKTNKKTLYLMKARIISFLKSRIFIFDLKRELRSSYFFVIAITLFHIAGPCVWIFGTYFSVV